MSFIDELQAAELHWHFEQARKAFEAELYLPSILSYLAAIENSIRITLHQLNEDKYPDNDELGTTLSNSLLRIANKAGLPIEKLAFPNEDIISDIIINKPNVTIVNIRHNLLHGNILPYINKEYGIFTPECLRETAMELDMLSVKWVKSLSQFRRSKKL